MNIAKAFEFERRVSMHSIQSMYVFYDDGQANWWERQLFTLFHRNRPNAALNLSYDWHALRINMLKAPSEFSLKGKGSLEEKEKTLLGFGIANIYLRDPVVKILLSLSSPQFETYIEKHYDTFAQIHLLTLKLET